LRFPKFVVRCSLRQILTAAPSSPRFISHRERFGDDAADSATLAYSIGRSHDCLNNISHISLNVNTFLKIFQSFFEVLQRVAL